MTCDVGENRRERADLERAMSRNCDVVSGGGLCRQSTALHLAFPATA